MRHPTPIRSRRLTLETLETRRVLENHAPVLDTSGPAPMLAPYFLNNNYENSGTVSGFAGARISDLDGGAKGIAIVGLTTTGNPQGNGSWMYLGSSGWIPLSSGHPADPFHGRSPSDNAALVLGPGDRVRFTPSNQFLGIPELKFRAWDMTDGVTPGSIIDTTGKQGCAGAYSLELLSAKAVLYDRTKIVTAGTSGYQVSAAPISIAPNAMASDFGVYRVGGKTFKAESVSLSPYTSPDAQDVIALGGPFTVDANQDVRLNGMVIGHRTSDGAELRPLTVTLSNNATIATLRQLVRSITFSTTGDFGNRQIEFSLNDFGDAYTYNYYAGYKVVKVTDYGKLTPVITTTGTMEYETNAAPVTIAPEATLTNTDIGNRRGFSGAILTVSSDSRSPQDILSFAAPFRLDLRYANLVEHPSQPNNLNGAIGELLQDGVGGKDWKIRLYSNVGRSMVEQLIKSITYQSTGGTAGPRKITFNLTIGEVTGIATKTVNVAAPTGTEGPMIGNFGGDVNFTEEASPTRLASNATVSTTAASFIGGVLRARLSVNAGADDRLVIPNTGSVTTSGNHVLVGGTPIGVSLGGSKGTPLVVTFNAAADAVGVQDVLQALAFSNASKAPSAATREMTITLTDGAGAVAASRTKSITFTPVNDAPVLSGICDPVSYVHNSPSIALASQATLADVDSFNFGGGKLRVRISTGSGGANRLEIGVGFTLDANNNVRQGTKIIGRLNTNGGVGTTELIVTFNVSATRSIVEALTRSITFRTVSGSAGTRKVLFSLYDGDGGRSAELAKTVNVT